MKPYGACISSYLAVLSACFFSNAFAVLDQPFARDVAAPTNLNLPSYPKLMDATLDELNFGLTTHQFTSTDLVKAYIARINEVNGTLSAVTEINPDALAIATQLDQERAKGQVRSPLHGIPVLIKGTIGTNDKLSTSAGSFALLGAQPSRDATVIAKLRKAGAVILGKANLSEWANYRSVNTTNGWSAYGGQCTAAYYPSQDPSGSSSGPAVGSSLGLSWAALGTETAGSIVLPADRSNVVGIKPTVGLTSRTLVVPVSQRADTIGPLARSVKDAAYLLQAIAGPDPSDNYTLASPYQNGNLPNYVAACAPGSLIGKRIGVPRNLIFPSTSPAEDVYVTQAFNTAIAQIRSLGATVVDNTNVTSFAITQMTTGNSLMAMLGVDFKSDLPAKYLSQLSSNPRNISDLSSLRQFVQTDPREQYPYRDTGRWDAALSLPYNNTDPRFWSNVLLNRQIGGNEGILGVMKNNSLDALILPTFSAYFPATYVGSPIVSVPLGFYPNGTKVTYTPPKNRLVATAPNVPFGISFLGPLWSEERLISFAYAYEQRTGTRARGRPYVLPKTELGDVVGKR